MFEEYYYLSSYSVLIYNSLKLLCQYGTSFDLGLDVNGVNYDGLTYTGVGFLASDFVYKWLHTERSVLYYALQAHHVLGVAGYTVAYVSGFGRVIPINTSLFEISSIPLLFYSKRVNVPVTLPLTWISYLLVRVVWGNYVLLGTLRSTWNTDLTRGIALSSYLIHAFFLFANNYWFYLLTRSLVRQPNHLTRLLTLSVLRLKRLRKKVGELILGKTILNGSD